MPKFKSKFLPLLALLLSFVLVFFLGIRSPSAGEDHNEILWDNWGVPHIYSQDTEGLFQAFGWAQTSSHGNLMLRLYGQARGRAAEYWGEKYLESDHYVRTMGIPARGQQWYAAQSPTMRRYLDAFAAGINAYAQENPEQIDDQVEAVLPINGADILAHVQRVIHFHFVVNPQQIASPGARIIQAGSNGWAIAPTHSASGHAMLLANPHLPWSDLYLLYEAQLTAPGIDAYGVAFVGMPALAIAFNDHLGWTATVNTFDGADIYQLTLAEGGYLLDGEVRPFRTESQTLKIRQADGSLREEQLVIRHSIHGPVIAQKDGTARAVRVVGLEEPHLMEQLWQMAQSTNRKQFEAALQSLQLPMFNLLYADQEGQILYIFNAQVPVRSQGDWDYWQGIVPGDTSETLWQKYHPYQDLPRVLNPASGWLQNTNDPPWTTTFPPAINSQDYPSYLAPNSLGKVPDIFRSQRSIRMLREDQEISFEEMIADKFSSRLEMADRLLDELIAAARELGNDLGRQAADVLQAWDRQTDAHSRGAVLFTLWAQAMPSSELFAQPWQEQSPLITPNGIANLSKAVEVLEETAAQLKSNYGLLDVPWGEVVRLRYGAEDLPASGSLGQLGSFRVLFVAPTDDGHFQTLGGDSYIAAIEFSGSVKAKVLNTYGNATQPGSPHIGDQLPLYSRGELRPAWRTREEIEAHLESRQLL
ncbi:penicillin acylase family protein [Lyngbya aestuarii]|uniref:penicillin acylase family protein n=1 Tax=Lyngbya aestuarii TaxID=118322 RepID=UPI00403DFC17